MIIEKYKGSDRYAKISIRVFGKEVAIRTPEYDFPLPQQQVEDYRRMLADSLVSTALDIMTEEIEWRDGLKPAEER